MGRTEHYKDPDAPTPNRIVPAATVFVQDNEGRVLLIQRSDNGLWALPGGVMEVGETIAQCAERETLEETGFKVKVVDIVGVYSDPEHIIEYDDGEIRQQFALCFRALPLGGSAKPSGETPDVAWVGPIEMDEVPMHPSTRLRVHHGLERLPHSHIG